MKCPFMAPSNHLMHGFSIFELLSSSLELYEVMLTILYFTNILPKDICTSSYMWMTLLS